MRFIIHEQPYEQPLASGIWHYFQDGRPTRAVEKWRLSEAVDGYRFLRVDLDARSAQSGRSYLYHLTMDRDSNPVQLKFRYWARGFEIIGNVLLEADTIIVSREVKGQRFEDVLPMTADYLFWFPASTGLGLLANSAVKSTDSAVSLRTDAQSLEKQMAPFTTTLDFKRGAYEKLEIMNEQKSLSPLTICWANQQRIIWINENNWPLKMERSDGLIAVETHYLQYQRISQPGE